MAIAARRWWPWPRRERAPRGGPGRPPDAPRASFARRHRRLLIALGATAVVLAAIRIALPFVATWYAEKVLNETPGYAGSIDGIDMSLWRGAYAVRGIAIDTVDKHNEATPLLRTPRLALTLAWGELIHGRIVAQAVVEHPIVRIDVAAKEPQTPKEEKKAQSSAGDTTTADDVWQEKIRKLTPITIDRIELRDAEVRLVDHEKGLDLSGSSLDGVITDLSNVSHEGDGSGVARIDLAGATMGGGKLALKGTCEPLALDPTFHVELTLEGVDMTALNPLLKAYGGLDVKRGALSVYADVACDRGELDGYLKPIIKDLDVAEPKKDVKEGVGHAIKEAAAGAAAKVLQNRKKDQQAAVVELKGRLEGPKGGVGHAIATTLRNAFVKALKPGLGGDG